MDTDTFNRLIRAVISIANTTDIAVVGTHSLPFWLRLIPENTLIHKDNPALYPSDSHVELCYYGTSKAADDVDCLIHSVFSKDTLYSRTWGTSVGMVDCTEMPSGWLSRAKKFKMGIFNLEVIHPTDLYHYLLPLNPKYASIMVANNVVKNV